LSNTPKVTKLANVAEFVFLPYEQALREVVPLARQDGAELVMVPAHVCLNELRSVVQSVADLGISLFGAGHCNEFTSFTEGGAIVLAGGYHEDSYAYAQFSLDPQTHQILDARYGIEHNRGGTPDRAVSAVIGRWAQATDAELNQPIGYLKHKVNRQSREMQALITETWVLEYPNADVALTNLGGMRADLPEGELTLADLISAMPFDNVLIEIQLTGAQLIDVITRSSLPPVAGGVSLLGGNWRLRKTGEPLQMDQTYSVLVNDFMYAGGDNYTLLAKYDPDGYNTAIDWRQPVIDWILAQNSNFEQPLDEIIADLYR
jgi:5'-nucleotidase/UDP-sugar diphosphatase